MRVNGVPGPGAYNDSVAFNRLSSAGRGVKFSKNERDISPDEKPGPGAYDANSYTFDKRSPAVKFGKDVRDKGLKSELPGPGAYDYQVNYPGAGSKYSFGRAPRDKQIKNEGPEFYDIPHSIPNVPKYNYPEPSKRKIRL